MYIDIILHFIAFFNMKKLTKTKQKRIVSIYFKQNCAICTNFPYAN
jgi:hypothetical protein